MITTFQFWVIFNTISAIYLFILSAIGSKKDIKQFEGRATALEYALAFTLSFFIIYLLATPSMLYYLYKKFYKLLDKIF